MALLVLLLASITLGWLPTPWWTAAFGPAIGALSAVYSALSERPNYDMPGFGVLLSAVLGVACLVSWLAARGVRAGAHQYRDRRKR